MPGDPVQVIAYMFCAAGEAVGGLLQGHPDVDPRRRVGLTIAVTAPTSTPRSATPAVQPGRVRGPGRRSSSRAGQGAEQRWWPRPPSRGGGR